MAKFTFYSDPGHGWLQVPVRDIIDIGMHPADFSDYSYRAGRGPDATLYLEEDCDAPKFLGAYERVKGCKPECPEAPQDGGFIRSLARNGGFIRSLARTR